MADSETTPLLRAKNGSAPSLARSLATELRVLASTSIPASLGYMVQNSIQTVSIAIVTNYGTDQDLSASAHGFMIAMVTAWTIALGGTTAFDTLASAAFARSKQGNSASHVGILLQRIVFVLMLVYIPCAALWYFSAPILIKLGQPVDVAIAIQKFLRILAWGAPGYILFESGKKFCLIQGSSAPTIVLFIMLPVNILLNFLMIHWLGLGMIGSPIAVSITYYLCALLLLIHVKTFGRSTTAQAWSGFDRRALELWPCLQMLRLALPGILMVGSEWVAFEIVALAAGNLDATSLAAQSVIMTCDQILNTLPFGLGVAASSRIGNILGDSTSDVSSLSTETHKPRKSSIRQLKITSQAATLFATILGAIIATGLLVFRNSFGRLFSDEAATVAKVASVIPLVASFQIFDGWAAANGGTLRGMGKQHVGAAANLISYYVLALPMGIYLAFRYNGPGSDWGDDNRDAGMGLRGLWIGNASALCLVGIAEWLIVSWTRWDREISKAAKRGRDEGQDE
ncbi:hypothetical protein CBS101457_006895 [Exobasidium rhododendri]|nr:hypothetical protein CBS101457_006895 [Exobasidium rhododendri]